ncbi:hypothetical protein HZA97_09135 [Candidatus Woesearchaeota archaeon]|nr:hypothetical protein [Candidatus Woesearchaeota archaeon]
MELSDKAKEEAREKLSSSLDELITVLSEVKSHLEIPKQVYDDAIKLIEPKYHADFAKFVENGEANKEFLEYLDSNENAQKAVDILFETTAIGLEEIGKIVQKEREEIHKKRMENDFFYRYYNNVAEYFKKLFK